jgi:histidyl-tRNA synthetase
MKTPILSVKGTRDFYPEEMAIRNWLYKTAGKVAGSFGYQEYEGPYLESIELYAAKSGDELVNQQSYVFPDRDGNLITLRPELTPTLARMVAKRQRQLVYPLRWWSFGPCWRYERPQKGRSREFFQWNVDLLGVSSPEADAEVVAIVASFFGEVGLSPSQVNIHINDRRLVEAELAAMGVPASDHPTIFRLIDRRDKLSEDEWEAYAGELGISAATLNSLKKMLANEDLWKKSGELTRFFSAMKAMGLSAWVLYDPGIIRGLDYYTGIVFEAQEAQGDIRRAVLGGGRYDNLMEAVGGEPLPAAGFAMGDMVISLILQKHNLLPRNLVLHPASVLVTVFDEESQPASLTLAAELREAGIQVDCYPEAAKLGKQFKYADRAGIRLAVVLGSEEIANGLVAIKDLRTGSQEATPRGEAAAAIRKMLAVGADDPM